MLSFLNQFFLNNCIRCDVAVVNPNGTSTLLADAVSTLFNNSKPTFINVPRSLRRNPPDCIIFDT